MREKKASLKSTIWVTIAFGMLLAIAGKNLPNTTNSTVVNNFITSTHERSKFDESTLPSNKAPIITAKKNDTVVNKGETVEIIY